MEKYALNIIKSDNFYENSMRIVGLNVYMIIRIDTNLK